MAKREKPSVDFDFHQSERKSFKVKDSQVDLSFQLVSSCESVWPGLNSSPYRILKELSRDLGMHSKATYIKANYFALDLVSLNVVKRSILDSSRRCRFSQTLSFFPNFIGCESP